MCRDNILKQSLLHVVNDHERMMLCNFERCCVVLRGGWELVKQETGSTSSMYMRAHSRFDR
jgi:hypothetical protein